MVRVENRRMGLMHAAPLLLTSLALIAASCSGHIDRRCDDRTYIERVYYEHRLGNKPPFEESLPPSLIEELVRKDLRKEAALGQAYGVEITPEMLEAEVQRINTTTRAPEMLEEIKTALGDDPVRFANALAKPFLVERMLRERFENDDAAHAARRRETEAVRERLLAARRDGTPVTDLRTLIEDRHTNQVAETTWQLGARPAGTNAQSSSEELELRERFGPDAQLLSSPHRGDENREFYFHEHYVVHYVVFASHR
jgi:hypothetical protein